MFIIDSPDKSLTVKLGESIDSSELIWSVSYLDTFLPRQITGTTNGTTNVDIVKGITIFQSPPQNTNRNIQEFTIYNSDIITHSVIIFIVDATNERIKAKILLEPENTLHFDDSGWYVTTLTGARLSTIVSASGIVIGDGVTGGENGSFLYVDGDTTVQNSVMKQMSPTSITIPESTNFGSDALGQSQFNFGSGQEFNFTTDGGIAAQSQLLITPSRALIKTVDGYFDIENSSLTIQHSTFTQIWSPFFEWTSDSGIEGEYGMAGSPTGIQIFGQTGGLSLSDLANTFSNTTALQFNSPRSSFQANALIIDFNSNSPTEIDANSASANKILNWGSTNATTMNFGRSGQSASFKGIVNLNALTASTAIYLDSSKNIVSLANASGVLTNNGSGLLSWTTPAVGTVTSVTSADGNATVATTTTTPVITIVSAPKLQTARTIGGVSFDGTSNIVPQTIQSINEATDTTCYPLFISASGSQSLQPLNNAGFIYNSNTNALTATNFIGALTGNASTVTNGVYTTNNLSVFSSTTSAQLAGIISDETGSGLLVFGTSPSITTPTLLLANTTPTSNGGIGYDQTNKFLSTGDGTTARRLAMGASIDFSGTASPTGYLGTPTVTLARYFEFGAMRIIEYDITGTSNAGTVTITIPFTSIYSISNPSRIMDNSINATSFGVCIATAGSTSIQFGKDASTAGGFTTSNTKRVRGTIILEV